jgi:hypothetical protein
MTERDWAREMIRVVGDMPPPEQPDEFVHGSFSLLSAALSKLPEWECERILTNIEDDLRDAVKKFSSARRGVVMQ